MSRYLLDTNILSDLVRNPRGQVSARIAAVGERSICTSIVVAAELRFGAAKRGSARLTAQLEHILSALDVLPFDAPADIAYAKLRAGLEAAGLPIGGNDMLIAAHALCAGCVVVTDNEREFVRVEGLEVANWLR
ncbi:type II toxin-antitoxin system VapC family toxin [Phenylobacterium sp.]|uniref:type II toxin-antitoxin system VapC family toxin n=1 Tax=Phenylobacterium sp. TaxID=1871053 RepID=UPI0025F10651|nr:type II toxin-antitoxin system VapC family toxin [Phenylobacterium sp.]MBX3482302.1 type II toxin-antitoxin system VapC family toxin [Phenylobacterium sp.]